MTSTLPNLGLLIAEVVTEPDWPVSGLSRFNDIAQELQIHALDDLHTINLTMGSSSEDLQCDANWKQYLRIQCRDTYTALASSLHNIALALKITNPYHSRGPREYRDPFLQQCHLLMKQSAYHVRCFLACHGHQHQWSSCFLISSNYCRLQRRLHGVRQRFLQSKFMVLDSDATDAVEAFRSLAGLTCTRAGIDPSRFKQYFKLPGRLGVYEIVGRISRMYKVVKVKPKVACKLNLENYDWCTTADHADVDWISLAYQLSTLIIKDSWLIKDKAAAEVGQSMLRGISCCFGVPEVLAAYEVKDCLGAPITTRRLSSATFGKDSIDRVLHREIIKTEGKDLREAATVQILLKAILHAMLATRKMHRDARQSIEEASLFDTMKEVSEPGTPGTLTFMSSRLLQALVLQTRTMVTAIDDLESFIWVLCWAVFEICLKHRKLNSLEQLFRDDLHRPSDIARMIKEKTVYGFSLQRTRFPLGQSLTSIAPLVEKWWDLAATYRERVTCILSDTSSDTHRALNALCKEAFREYLDEGFRALDKLECQKIDW
ncbi:uncharacterized protein ARMOST_11970 [Armillaria ostoyae]|uniref:Fungal-type protein kinase domain-containing protein n=1 Tax=Armillaria ostoyae TaxID=47428 RepID=A0A284RIN7_ARMOS|nr:uncharacterized protein ARMOST_11970 [Armillaria ostoyae]